MIFLGIGKVNKTAPGKTVYIAEITEAEADMITGVAGKPHISGRYRPGAKANIAAIYQKVKQINQKHAEIKAAAVELQADAVDMQNAIPLTEES